MNTEQLLRFALRNMTAAKYARITLPEGHALKHGWIRNIAEDACDIEGLTLHLHYELTKKPSLFRPYYTVELRHVSVPGHIELPPKLTLEYDPANLTDVIPGIKIDYTKSEQVSLAPFIPE